MVCQHRKTVGFLLFWEYLCGFFCCHTPTCNIFISKCLHRCGDMGFPDVFVDQLAAGLRSAQDARVKQILPARLGALFAGHEALFIEDLRWRSELQPQVKTIAATSGKHVHLGLGFIVSTQVKWDYLRGRFAKMHVIIFSPCCWPIFFEKP